MLDQSRSDFHRVLSTTRKNLEAPMWETSLLEDRAEDPEAARSKLMTFEDYGITCCQSVCDSSCAEVIRCVPRRIQSGKRLETVGGKC